MRETEVVTGSTALVIFGVTGDLTRRKLVPALYELILAKRLPEKMFVIGFARRDWTDDYLRQQMRDGVLEFTRSHQIDEEVLQRLLDMMFYVRSSFDEAEGYRRLGERITELGVDNCLFYLSDLAPQCRDMASQPTISSHQES